MIESLCSFVEIIFCASIIALIGLSWWTLGYFLFLTVKFIDEIIVRKETKNLADFSNLDNEGDYWMIIFWPIMFVTVLFIYLIFPALDWFVNKLSPIRKFKYEQMKNTFITPKFPYITRNK